MKSGLAINTSAVYDLLENITMIIWLCFTAERYHRKTGSVVLYYDWYELLLECEQADDAIVDEGHRRVINRSAAYGTAKNTGPNPIVEMGYSWTAGIPITMCCIPQYKRAADWQSPGEEVLRMIPNAKFHYCADAGLGSYNIRKSTVWAARSLLYTTIKKLGKHVKKPYL